MADHLSEQDEATLRTLAMIERTTVAEQRRKALRAYAKRARQNPNVAELVQIQTGWKREREARKRSNVIELRGRRAPGA